MGNVSHRQVRLSLVHEAALARRIQQGDVQARDQLVEANLGLVMVIAKRYHRCSVPLDDLVQEGALGLLRAAARYDPSRKVKFSTYAAWSIRNRILDAIARSALIPVPSRVKHRQTTMPPTDAMPTEASIVEGIADERLEHPLEQLIADEETSSLVGWLTTLPIRYHEVIERRYGLGGHASQSHRQIASGLGFGEDRSRQLEREALQRLRTVASSPVSRTSRG